MFRNTFMVGNIHSGILSNDSNVYSYPITFQPEAWIITVSLSSGYILVYPQNGRGALSFKLDKGRIRIPLHTDTITIETVGATGYFDAHPVYERKSFDITTVPGSYLAKMLGMFGQSVVAYWPLNEQNGSVAFDASGNGRNGVHNAVTLAQPGIGDGLTSTKYDGSTSDTNVFSAALQAAFNNSELTISIWVQVRAASVWSDGATRGLFYLSADASNIVAIRKQVAANTILGFYTAGGVVKQVSIAGVNTTGWFHVALTVSKIADKMILYLNGVQQGATQTVLGVWAGSLAATLANIGAQSSVPSLVHDGNLAHAIILNRAATSAEILNAATIGS